MHKGLIVAVLLATTAHPALSGVIVPSVTDAVTTMNCGNCHMVYQPALLSAGSWERLMNGLDDHFGEKAALPKDVRDRIATYLKANASTRKEDAAVNAVRITDSPHWVDKHRKVKPEDMKRALSKANCPACHSLAEAGDYGDD